MKILKIHYNYNITAFSDTAMCWAQTNYSFPFYDKKTNAFSVVDVYSLCININLHRGWKSQLCICNKQTDAYDWTYFSNLVYNLNAYATSNSMYASSATKYPDA